MTSKPTRPVTDQVDPAAGDPGQVSPAAGGPGQRQRVRDGDVKWATFGYLGVIFLGPVIPLIVYLIRGKKSPFIRYHAATAVNLALTGALYALCCLIIGGLLLLDNVTVALVIALPLGFLIWVLLLRNVIRGVIAASRGEKYQAAAWICARFLE